MWIGDRRGGSQDLHRISTCSPHRGQPQQISLATARLITSFGRWAHHLQHGTSGPAGPCWVSLRKECPMPAVFERLVGLVRRDPRCRSVELHPCHVVEQWSALSRGMPTHWTPGRSYRDARPPPPPPPALISLAACLVLPVFSASLAGRAGVSPGGVSSRTLVAT